MVHSEYALRHPGPQEHNCAVIVSFIEYSAHFTSDPVAVFW